MWRLHFPPVFAWHDMYVRCAGGFKLPIGENEIVSLDVSLQETGDLARV